MKQNSDSGHLVNVINFDKLITICTSFNSNYNPSVTSITIGSLQLKYQSASEAAKAANTAEPLLKNAIAMRKIAFSKVDKLTTRVKNAFIAINISAKANDNAASLVRKIHGQRASPKKTKEEKAEALKQGKEIVEHSSAQTSFDSKVENLDKFINFLATFAEYKPNEEELTIASLTSLYNDLKAKNNAVTTADANAKAARILRDEQLYHETEGAVTVANQVKAYVKSIYGATSPQFKQLSKLKFSHQ